MYKRQLIGNALGARDERLMRRLARMLVGIEMVLMVVSGGLLFIFAPGKMCIRDSQQDGPQAERSGPFYTDGWLEDEPYYRPIIINAQSGEIIDPENNANGRCMAPEIEAW